MAQHTDTQHAAPATGQWLTQQGVGTNPAPPELLTKKWLADYFGCRRPGGTINVDMFYRLVLTPNVLAELGLKEADVRLPSFKTFTRQQSVRLREILSF